ALRDLRGDPRRDVNDAAVDAMSGALRFQAAYQAAFHVATIVLAASGYRTTGVGHHWATFKVLPEVLGPEFQELAAYFDQCRGKRNLAGYDRAGEIAGEEATELLEEARKFRRTVLSWVRGHHPK